MGLVERFFDRVAAVCCPREARHGRGRGRLGRVAPVCCPSGRGLACNHLA